MKKRKRDRQSRALKARSRKSYLGLAIGGAFGVVLFVIAFSVVPTVSNRQLAETVRAQAVRDTRSALPVHTGPPVVSGAARGQADGSDAVPGAGDARAANTNLVRKLNAPNAPRRSKEDYLAVGFDTLSSFRFVVTDRMVDATQDSAGASLGTTSQIPNEIKALNEKNVAIKGFMLPVKFDGAFTTEFLILKSQGLCCYGVVPKINEWVNVRLPGKGVKPIMDQPVTVCGTFHAGELRENGELVGIYRLDCDHLIKP
jgi:hypothetical protein